MVIEATEVPKTPNASIEGQVGPAYPPRAYSPKCLEGVFCEVRLASQASMPVRCPYGRVLTPRPLVDARGDDPR